MGRRPLLLLSLGAATGLTIAIASLPAGPAGEGWGERRAVARINGVPILRERFERLVAALEIDLRRAVSDAERRDVLDRLIDEELLVQRGLELGLALHDRQVRADLVSAVLGQATSGAELREPNDRELRDFYTANREFFARSDRLRVQRIYVEAGPDAEPRLAEIVRRLANGDRLHDGRDALGDAALPPVPDALLPRRKLREYLGPTVVRAVAALEPGAVSEPIRSGTDWHVVRLIAREGASLPELDTVAEAVRAEWRRREAETALRDYLDELRVRAELEGDVR